MQKSIKTFLLGVILLFHLNVFSQPVANHNPIQDNDVENSFDSQNYRLQRAEKDIVVYRYVTDSGFDINRVKESRIYCTPQNFHSGKDAAMRQNLMSLPRTNEANRVVKIVIPKGTPYYSGIASNGVMTYSKNKDGSYKVEKFYSPNTNSYDEIVRRYKSNNADYRSGGAIQYYIPEEYSKMVKVIDTYSLDPPPNGSPNGRTLPPVKTNTNSSYDMESIQQINEQYNRFPGGIIIQPKGKVNFKTSSVRYDATKHRFILNEEYIFEPEVGEEELGTIYQAVFEQDGKFGAISSDEMVGMPNDGSIALTLGQADQFLGTIAYGYNTDGLAPSTFVTVKGYQNPLLMKLKELKSANISTLKSFIAREFSGLQPRLFMNFKEVEFGVVNKMIVPREVDMTIQYQAFYTKNDRTYKFAKEHDPKKYFPYFVEAIKHLENNYDAYEKKSPFFYSVRKIAETYAFMSWLKKQNIEIENKEAFREAFKNRQPITYISNNYNAISKNSDLHQFYLKSMGILERQKVASWSSMEQLQYYDLLLSNALNTNQFNKIVRYRKKCTQLSRTAFQKHKKRFGLYNNYQQYNQSAKYRLPSNVVGQMNFAHRYSTVDKQVHQKNLKKAMTWLQRMVKLEPNYATLDYASSLMSHVDTLKSKQLLNKCYDWMEKDAMQKNDAFAQYIIGWCYYNGKKRPKNLKKGSELMLRASKNGNMYAQCAVGTLYFNSGKNEPKKLKAAISLVYKSAKQDFYQAQYNMGYFYEHGWMTGEPDHEKAKYWYNLAKSNGHHDSLIKMSQLSL